MSVPMAEGSADRGRIGGGAVTSGRGGQGSDAVCRREVATAARHKERGESRCKSIGFELDFIWLGLLGLRAIC